MRLLVRCVLLMALVAHAGILRADATGMAAVLPQTLNASVSGRPASAKDVREIIAGAIRTRLVTVEGANVSFELPKIDELADGTTETFVAKARVTADAAKTSFGDVTVVVKNLGLPAEKDSALWYSNSPESVQRPGPLFSSNLKQGSPVRFLYHHLNASEMAIYLRVEAINDSDVAAQVFIMPGDADPDRNSVRAGFHAANQYFHAWSAASGEVVTIPPRSTIPISLRRLLPGETASGLTGLRWISGPPEVQIRADAWPPFPVDKRWEAALWSSEPWRIVGSHSINDYDRAPFEQSDHVYPNPYREDVLSYRVGGRFGAVRIGPTPISRQDDQQKLDGNFGVVYTIHASIANPTSQASDVELVFEASAGYGGAVAIIDGDYRTTPLLQPKQETRLGKFHLEPGARREFTIITLPVSGCSYPATLTLRPAVITTGGAKTGAQRKPQREI